MHTTLLVSTGGFSRDFHIDSAIWSVCVCCGGQRTNLTVISQVPCPPPFFETGSPTDLNVPSRLDWLVSEPLGSSCLLIIKVHHQV